LSQIHITKESLAPDTPVLLFDCRLANGVVERWATHSVHVEGESYAGRVLEHGSFELGTNTDEGFDGPSRITVVLANSDAYASQIERSIGFKGSRLTVWFVFIDAETGMQRSNRMVLFKGTGNTPEESDERAVRLQFSNRLSLQRISLPPVRIQRQCPWSFPSTESERAEAVSGRDRGKYSPFFACGYSPDQPGGSGNLDGAVPFTTCKRTRADCERRGMFQRDQDGRLTARFGGVEFVPASSLVRGAGEASSRLSTPLDNVAKYNDVVPMLYGTGWFQPPIVFAKNDGNLTRMEVLLGVGEMAEVLKVVVNGFEVAPGESGADMSGTGWFNVVTLGNRTGGFNLDFTDRAGIPLGDPYGGMAYASVVVPNRVSDGRSLPRIEVLARGITLSEFDSSGNYTGERWSSNPAWVILDCLRRSGWELDEIDLPSFGTSASYCDEELSVERADGVTVPVARAQANVVIRRRQSAAEIVRGILIASGLTLSIAEDGRLRLRPEQRISLQQPYRPAGSNSTMAIADGWPAYEFCDGTYGYSGILRKGDGAPSFRLFSRSTSEAPNRVSVEFQNEWNEYQQDSLSVVDVEDATLIGHEVTASLGAIGLPNPVQAAACARRFLAKSLFGNLYVEFETSLRGIGIWPNDLISVTYAREGLDRQLFRVLKVVPGPNFESAWIVAQVHDDDWYIDGATRDEMARRELSAEVGIPRPIGGRVLDEAGEPMFEIEEAVSTAADGQQLVELTVRFEPPPMTGISQAATPRISFSPQVENGLGALQQGGSLFYAVTAKDEFGIESGLSFVARADMRSAVDAGVRLTGLAFDSRAVGMAVYRGGSSQRLRRISNSGVPASEFFDSGLPEVGGPPPDASYDHARFYWRRELAVAVSATEWSSSIIGSQNLALNTDEFAGARLAILRGRGAGQERRIIANDSRSFAVEPAWSVVPDESSVFAVVEANWRFAGSTTSDTIVFEVPNRGGATIEIQGRSANVRGQECAAQDCLISRWTIGGGGNEGDSEKPPAPQFALSTTGRGAADLVGVSFLDLGNTRSVNAGTLTVRYRNELSMTALLTLPAGLDEDGVEVEVSEADTFSPGDWLQCNRELMLVEEKLSATQYRVMRGGAGSEVADHVAGSELELLDARTIVVPFVRGSFGSTASGSYTWPVWLANARIACAELFVTNSVGNSESTQISFTNTADRGLRTLFGGETTIHVNGYLSIQSSAGPAVVIGEARSTRDVFAIVQEAATNGEIVANVNVDGDVWCVLTIASGNSVSNIVPGSSLRALSERSVITLDIVSVPPSGSGSPGRDLTVTIRH
jgi:hypothetical protein